MNYYQETIIDGEDLMHPAKLPKESNIPHSSIDVAIDNNSSTSNNIITTPVVSSTDADFSERRSRYTNADMSFFLREVSLVNNIVTCDINRWA